MVDEKKFCILILLLVVIEGITLLSAQAFPNFLNNLNIILLEDLHLKKILDITYPAFTPQIKALKDNGFERVVAAYSLIVYFSFSTILIDLFSSIMMYRKKYVGELKRIENAIIRNRSSYYWALLSALLFTLGCSVYLLGFRQFTFDNKVQFIYPGHFGSLLNGLLIYIVLRFFMHFLLWDLPICIRFLFRMNSETTTQD